MFTPNEIMLIILCVGCLVWGVLMWRTTLADVRRLQRAAKQTAELTERATTELTEERDRLSSDVNSHIEALELKATALAASSKELTKAQARVTALESQVATAAANTSRVGEELTLAKERLREKTRANDSLNARIDRFHADRPTPCHGFVVEGKDGKYRGSARVVGRPDARPVLVTPLGGPRDTAAEVERELREVLVIHSITVRKAASAS